MKLRESNVFTRLCLSVCLFTWGGTHVATTNDVIGHSQVPLPTLETPGPDPAISNLFTWGTPPTWWNFFTMYPIHLPAKLVVLMLYQTVTSFWGIYLIIIGKWPPFSHRILHQLQNGLFHAILWVWWIES